MSGTRVPIANPPEEDTTAVTREELISLQPKSSEEEEDALLHRAVCTALVQLHPPKSHFPLKVATFYAKHVAPFRCPPDDHRKINLKATSYKKFSTYLNEQAERKLLTLSYTGDKDKKTQQNKEQPADSPSEAKKKTSKTRRTVDCILGFDRTHDDLTLYLRECNEQKAQHAADDADDATGLVPRRLYCIPHKLKRTLGICQDENELLGGTDSPPDNDVETEPLGGGTGTPDVPMEGSLFSLAQVNAVLDDYLGKHALVDPLDHGMVNLNQPLRDALNMVRPGDEQDGTAALMTRKTLGGIWKSAMTEAYILEEMPSHRVVRRGYGPPPTVTIEARPSGRPRGGRGLTRICGLATYGISPEEFCRDVGNRFGCGTHTEDKVVWMQGRFDRELEALLLGKPNLVNHGGVKDSQYHLSNKALKVSVNQRLKHPNKGRKKKKTHTYKKKK